MLENDKPASAEVALHIDRCLSCLSCVTTCPSGVDYTHLIDQARVRVEKTYSRPVTDRLVRTLLARVLPYPNRFRAALKLARWAKPLLGGMQGGGNFGARLRTMLGFAPAGLPPAGNLKSGMSVT